MGEASIDDVESYQESATVPGEDGKYHVQDMATPDVPNTAMKIERAREIYESAYTDIVVKPTNEEVWIWYLYELCSYFINNTLVPVLFPLIISQILKLPPEPARGWDLSRKGLSCSQKETKLYEALTHRSISVNNSKFSPLEWTSFSWGIGLLLAAPIVASISTHLDHGRSQILITGAAIAIGAFFCLPSGFFNVTWIFPPYIAAIVAASIVATASHTRQLGLMLAIKANAVRMHLLGFYLSIVTAAFGFYFRSKIWHKGHVLVLVGLQSTSVGLLHAFGRVLLIDCSPSGKEGAFSAWFSWCKALGTCAGFAVASAIPGNVSTSFGIAFFTAISGVILLNYGNISDFRGAIAAGHMSDEDDGLDAAINKHGNLQDKTIA
ncbi:hypothetical protein GH714_021482 [Hevea brasiliensis]|uniref:Major facilitator superfamily (MFS) profile domain-containing protein n=1 Tax=Hevea brasiliensis TaxID=3981 RepID=A0A6A6M549_HEVBR|nr:hypothetical protein GH714_021482 [Hevea brasiliensis]